MFRLGVGFKDRDTNYPLHHPKFEVDESAIITGVVTFAYAAYKYWQIKSDTTANLAPVAVNS
jgi:amidohydrolase